MTNPTAVTTQEKHQASLAHTRAKLERAIEDLVATDKLEPTYQAIEKQLLTLTDRSRALHPTFRKVLVEKTEKVARDKYIATTQEKISSQVAAQIHADTNAAVNRLLKEQAQRILDGNSGTELRKKLDEVWKGLQQIHDEIPQRITTIDDILAQVDKFKNFEFVKGVMMSTVLVRVDGEDALNKLTKKLQEFMKRIAAIEPEFMQILFTTDGGSADQDELDGQIRTALAQAYEVMEKYFPSLEAIALNTASAVSRMNFQINESMLDSYISQNTIETEQIDKLGKIGDAGLKLVESSAKSNNYSGFFMRVFELANAISVKAGKEAVIKIAKKQYSETRGKNTLFLEFQNHPDLFYKRLQQNQKEALDIFIKGLSVALSGGLLAAPPGIGETVMNAFEVATDAVTVVVEEVLRKRDELAQEKIKDMRDAGEIPRNPNDKGDKVFGKIQERWEKAYDGVTDELKAKLEDAIGKKATEVVKKVKEALEPVTEPTAILSTVYDPGKYASGDEEGVEAGVKLNPYALTSLLVKIIVPPILRWVMTKYKPKPAEILTGEQLVKILDDIHFSQLPVGAMLEVSLVPRTKATPVDTSKHAAVLRRFPDLIPKTIKGRIVLENNSARSQLDGDDEDVSVYVLLDLHGTKVWGRWYPASKKWVAQQVDQYAFYDGWRNVLVDGDAVTYMDTSTKKNGKWHRAVGSEVNFSILVFVPDGDDAWLTGHLMDISYGPRGTEYQLVNQIPERRVIQTKLEELFTV